MKNTAQMHKVKVTKNTVRYDYPGDRENTPIPAVYVQKSHLPTPHPEMVKITIETD